MQFKKGDKVEVIAIETAFTGKKGTVTRTFSNEKYKIVGVKLPGIKEVLGFGSDELKKI